MTKTILIISRSLEFSPYMETAPAVTPITLDSEKEGKTEGSRRSSARNIIVIMNMI